MKIKIIINLEVNRPQGPRAQYKGTVIWNRRRNIRCPERYEEPSDPKTPTCGADGKRHLLFSDTRIVLKDFR